MAKCTPLAKFLEDSARTEGTAILSFTQTEGLMAKALLMSARGRRSWWGDDSYHLQPVARQAAGRRAAQAIPPSSDARAS